MTRASDPLALGRQWLTAQKAQLDMAETWLATAKATHAWQANALQAAETMARAHQQWLALWGLAL